MLRTMIVDDEPLARQRLQRFLSTAADIDLRWVCGDGAAAVTILQQEQVDLLFLDVQMPGLDGFGVLAALEEKRLPHIVFVTAYAQYAVQAFEVHAVDYLVKPFGEDAFSRVLAHVRAHWQVHEQAALVAKVQQLFPAWLATSPYPQRISVREAKAFTVIETADIDWIEGAGNYVTLHVGRASYLHTATLQEMTRQLDPAHFCRIHRSTIVNIHRVAKLVPLFRGAYAVTLKDGTSLKLSRSYRQHLPVLLGQPPA